MSNLVDTLGKGSSGRESTAANRTAFANGSILYPISGWSRDFDPARGINATLVVIDEMASLPSNSLAVVEQSLAHDRPLSKIIAIGTSTFFGTSFETMWRDSDM